MTTRSNPRKSDGKWDAARCRALVRSITTTRGSCRNFQASCPCPTSTANTRAAPYCSRQSVNPPVLAPDIQGRHPGGIHAKLGQSMLQLVSATADIAVSSEQFDVVRFPDAVVGLRGRMPIDANLSGHDEPLGLCATFAQPFSHHHLVQPLHGARKPQTGAFGDPR